MIVDRLYEQVEKKGHVCVGLDTDISYVPKSFAQKFNSESQAIFEFNKEIIDATKDVVACFKVQIAYYEALGIEGLKSYSDTLKYIKKLGLLSIADVKRGDIQKTAQMYAKAHFTGDFEADFLTLSPYMGIHDSFEPYLDYVKTQHKGFFSLVRTSNAGAKDFQYIKSENGVAFYENVGEKLEELGKDYIGECGFSSVGAVVGATNAEDASSLRNKMKHTFLLIPGYGAQGGKAEDIKEYLINGNGAVVSSSRAILLAYKNTENGEKDFAFYSREEAIRMRDDIKKYI